MQAAISDKVKDIEMAAEAFGPRLEPALSLLKSTLEHASSLESTPSAERTSGLAGAFESDLGLVEDIQETLRDLDVLYHHITAATEAAASFAWVLSDDPVAAMADATAELQPSLVALRKMKDPSHAQFADAVDHFVKTLSSYVNANHTSPLNFAQSSTPDAQEHTAPHAADFRSTVTDATVPVLQKASGGLGGPLPQATAHFANAVARMYDVILSASAIKSVPSDEKRQQMLAPLVSCATALSQISNDTPPSDPFFNHVKALEDAMPVMSWLVVDSTPVAFISDIQGTAAFYLNKVLVSSKKLPNATHHKAFVDALNAFFIALRAYVKEHHTTGLRYGLPLMATASSSANGSSSRRALPSEDAPGDGDPNTYVSAFKALVSGPVAAYVNACAPIAPQLVSQAKAFAAAFEAETEMLKIAINTPKPDDIQSMLAPIAAKMGEVGAIAEEANPREEYAHHLTAVSESIAALGWVAVDERATAFVGDMGSAGQFFIDKVKMYAKSSRSPESHRTWAKCLETVWSELKAYVKEYHTQKLTWNPPKRKMVPRSSVAAAHEEEDASGDYVSVFNELVSGQLSEFEKASVRLGGVVEDQSRAFANAWRAEAEFLSKALVTPKPDDVQSMLGDIASQMGEVAAVTEKAGPHGPFAQHLNAVSESISALGWVAVDEKATAFVGDMAGAGQFYIDKVKMGAKKTSDPSAHREWAKSLEKLWAGLKEYVKEHHTQKLVWNPPKRKVLRRGPSVTAAADDGDAGDYVTVFGELLSGPLAAFVQASKVLGGDVEKQALSFAGAWNAEAEFLKKALVTPKPEDVQGMLGDIAKKMGEAAAITEKSDPRGAFTQHLNAVSESISALGWVAVDEKATAFVGDMAGAGQFYIDKVKMGARKTDNPSAHREWAQSLEKLWGELKGYVKEYHTQKLIWNPPKKAKRSKASNSVVDEKGSKASNYVDAFEELVSGPVAAYVSTSKTLGGDLGKQADVFMSAWKAEADFLKKAIGMPKPEDVQGMLGSIAGKMGEISEIADGAGPRSEFSQHLQAVSESMAALGWVAVDEKAAVFVGEMASAGQFYIDKVKMGARKTDKADSHREWARCLETTWAELKAYVKEYHTQKLRWNS